MLEKELFPIKICHLLVFTQSQPLPNFQAQRQYSKPFDDNQQPWVNVTILPIKTRATLS